MSQDMQAQIDALNGRVTALEAAANTQAPASAPADIPAGTLPRGPEVSLATARGEWTFQAHPGTCEFITARRTGEVALEGDITVTAMDGTVMATTHFGPAGMDSYGKLNVDGLAAGGTYRLVVERPSAGDCYVKYV